MNRGKEIYRYREPFMSLDKHPTPRCLTFLAFYPGMKTKGKALRFKGKQLTAE